MLAVTALRVDLGGQEILGGVDLEVRTGEVVALIGRNGCGKSTTLRAIMGLVPIRSGAIVFDGVSVIGMDTKDRSRRGIAYVPQTGAIFPDLSVKDNLQLGGRMLGDRARFRERLDEVQSLFPILSDHRLRRASLLSGGQQRVLGVALALMRDGRLLLLDEPSAGLAPTLADELLEQVIEGIGPNRSVLLVEQNLHATLNRADRVVVIRNGMASAAMTPSDILASFDDLF